MTRRNLFSGNP